MMADHFPAPAPATPPERRRPELRYEYEPPPPGAQRPRDPDGPELEDEAPLEPPLEPPTRTRILAARPLLTFRPRRWR